MFIQCYKLGYRFQWIVQYTDLLPLREIVLPIFFANLLSAINGLVDQNMVSFFSEGSISTLDYGMRVFSVYSTLGITALTTLFLPRFSELISSNNYTEIRRLFNYSSKAIFIIGSILSVITILCSETIIKILFERGQFHAQDSVNVAKVMNCFLVSLPILLSSMLGVRLITALNKNKYLILLSLNSVILNVAFNYLFGFTMQMGVFGIALGTSSVYLINGCIILLIARNILKK